MVRIVNICNVVRWAWGSYKFTENLYGARKCTILDEDRSQWLASVSVVLRNLGCVTRDSVVWSVS